MTLESHEKDARTALESRLIDSKIRVRFRVRVRVRVGMTLESH